MAGLEASERIGRLTPMRILLTGHDGYIGTIMSQVLGAAALTGH